MSNLLFSQTPFFYNINNNYKDEFLTDDTIIQRVGVVQLKNGVVLDLTRMFGRGNEPSLRSLENMLGCAYYTLDR